MKRTVPITGASSGIGRATTLKLLNEDYCVYASARNLARLESLAASGAKILELDVTQDQLMQASIDRIIYESGRLDFLINNAGYGSYGALEDVPLDEARQQVEVNLFGKARYPVGNGARLLVTSRKFFSDSMMDILMQFMIRRVSSQ